MNKGNAAKNDLSQRAEESQRAASALADRIHYAFDGEERTRRALAVLAAARNAALDEAARKAAKHLCMAEPESPCNCADEIAATIHALKG